MRLLSVPDIAYELPAIAIEQVGAEERCELASLLPTSQSMPPAELLA